MWLPQQNRLCEGFATLEGTQQSVGRFVFILVDFGCFAAEITIYFSTANKKVATV